MRNYDGKRDKTYEKTKEKHFKLYKITLEK